MTRGRGGNHLRCLCEVSGLSKAKGHSIMRTFEVFTKHFKGTKAMTRGHGGKSLLCLCEESGLRRKCYTWVLLAGHFYWGMQDCVFVFERGKGTKAFSPWWRAPYRWGNCKFLLEHFKGTKTLTRGHGGNRLCCLREESGLRRKCYTWIELAGHFLSGNGPASQTS